MSFSKFPLYDGVCLFQPQVRVSCFLLYLETVTQRMSKMVYQIKEASKMFLTRNLFFELFVNHHHQKVCIKHWHLSTIPEYILEYYTWVHPWVLYLSTSLSTLPVKLQCLRRPNRCNTQCPIFTGLFSILLFYLSVILFGLKLNTTFSYCPFLCHF